MSYSGTWDPKDPDERKDYTIDWSDEIGVDPIVASTWILDDGDDTLAIGTGLYASSFTSHRARVWLVGGTAGRRVNITNRITTAGGRILDQTVPLRIKNK